MCTLAAVHKQTIRTCWYYNKCQMWVHREQMHEPSLGLHQGESLHNIFPLFFCRGVELGRRQDRRPRCEIPLKYFQHVCFLSAKLYSQRTAHTMGARGPGFVSIFYNGNIKENEEGGTRERSWGGVMMSDNMASCSSVKSAVAAHMTFFVPINRSKLSACAVCQQILSKEHINTRRKCSLPA